jgi:biofilm PGA synthesis N-glycosyltransferase PgaC
MHSLLLTGLAVILLWDGYFFITYIISLFKDYVITEWTPKVSIIIPAYNEGERALRAVKSALDQDYQDFEVVFVDDGSTDGTLDLVRSINDPRLKAYRIEHGGKARALNFGLSVARGEVVVTSDADGYLERDALKKLVERFYSPDVVAVGGQVRVQGDSLLERAQDVEHLRIATFRRAKELEDLSVAPGPVSAFRKDALRQVGGFIEDPVEDYATTKALKRLGRVVYAPRARAWVEMPGSLTTLWKQRKRWFLGDLEHLGGGFTKNWGFLILGDIIALLDILVPIFLLFTGFSGLFALWWIFETVTMLVPTFVEGGRVSNALLFPAFLYFWALFYLALHLYGYVSLLRKAFK